MRADLLHNSLGRRVRPACRHGRACILRPGLRDRSGEGCVDFAFGEERYASGDTDRETASYGPC